MIWIYSGRTFDWNELHAIEMTTELPYLGLLKSGEEVDIAPNPLYLRGSGYWAELVEKPFDSDNRDNQMWST